ncbi:MAG: Rrf2 family transcriptional regulator [Bacteroidales bacterium]|jgi:Rrf2 family protein|nr:Rrf2 family transcriptional regulator [Bacteroidales bacterium]MDD4214960.1 Rrf2 family transcriptional regulator [Bacteroidales bacterium]
MLSKKTQYSFYALVHLAREYQKGPVLISTISQSEKIPKKFLEAILLELKKNGYVESKKGKGGGYFLVKPPQQINLAEILRLFEGAIALLPCAAYKFYKPCTQCKDEKKCGLRSVIKDVREETVQLLKSYTLASVLKKEKELMKK